MAITLNDNLEPNNSPPGMLTALSYLASQIKIITGQSDWYTAPIQSLSELAAPGWNILSSSGNISKNQGNLIDTSSIEISIPNGLNQGDFFTLAVAPEVTGISINLNGYSYQGNSYPVAGSLSFSNQPQIYIYQESAGIIDLTGNTINFAAAELIGSIFSTPEFSPAYSATDAFDGNLSTTFGSAAGEPGYIGMTYTRNVYLSYVKFAPMLEDPTFGSQYAFRLAGTEVQALDLAGNWNTFYTIQESDFPPAGELATIEINSLIPCTELRFYNPTDSPNVSEIQFWGYYA